MRKNMEKPVDQNRRQRVATTALSAAWLINAALLFAAFAWTYFDGRSLQAMDFLRIPFGFDAEHFESNSSSGGTILTDTSVASAILAAALVSCTMLAILVGLFLGPPRFRTTRAWLVFMALACGWLGFMAGWPEVYWRGQQRRMKAVLAPAEKIARYLEANWPTDDGDLPGIGPYLAYPKGGPTTLLPLKQIAFPNTTLRFSAIERTNDDALRFELAGSEAGAWLERRPVDDVPVAFLSGLDTNYRVVRKQRLAPRWYLVRYRSAAGGSTL
jgi:hypothetical protein